MIVCTVTYPPSANRLWRAVKGRQIKSAEYRAWQKENEWLGLGRRDTIAGPYELHLVATAPDKRRRDLGNLEKAVSDLLQALGFVTDDCNMRRLVVEWGQAEKPGVAVAIREIGA